MNVSGKSSNMNSSVILGSRWSVYRELVRSISYYVTTPIFYVNSSPHIGHVHTLLLADALNVYNRLKLGSNETIFSTGTDEHGIKIQTAAEANKISYKKFCDLNSEKFRNLFRCYETTVTDFIRTTESRHVQAVEQIWTELDRRGFIYKCTYSGWYCTSDEVFVPESSVTKKEIDGQEVHVDQNGNQLVWSSEENYMFRMDLVKGSVMRWLKDSKPISPNKFNDDAIRMIADTKDISISRPKHRLGWGIRVPNDPSQTIYVWLDALTSYLTVAGYPCSFDNLRRWPIDCQVIGKDIIRFHAIYWPAFLTALSIHLPRKLICHSHWLVDSLKMSKSRGNVVDPWQENEVLTKDGLRYYLLRCATTHSDNDYSQTQAKRRINAELADTYGNLMNRCCAPAINPRQVIPKAFVRDCSGLRISGIIEQLDELAQKCADYYEEADFYKGVDLIMSTLRQNNALYEEFKPWKLVKEVETNEDAFKIYNNLQAITFESLRICSILLHPIVPNMTRQALRWLGVNDITWRDARVSLGFGDPKCLENKLVKNPASILFRRIKCE